MRYVLEKRFLILKGKACTSLRLKVQVKRQERTASYPWNKTMWDMTNVWGKLNWASQQTFLTFYISLQMFTYTYVKWANFEFFHIFFVFTVLFVYVFLYILRTNPLLSAEAQTPWPGHYVHCVCKCIQSSWFDLPLLKPTQLHLPMRYFSINCVLLVPWECYTKHICVCVWVAL